MHEPIISNGVRFPRLGLSTVGLMGRTCRDAVSAALSEGYRLIDTGSTQSNEREIGEAIRASAVPRDRLFMVSKMKRDRFTPGQIAWSVGATLARLDTDYLDLLLLPWPHPKMQLVETLQAMKALQREGLVRALGVCNFPPAQLAKAVDFGGVVCDQVEYHPYLSQEALLRTVRALDLVLMAYSPLAGGRALRDPNVTRIAAAHGRSPAQVVLRWLLHQPGVVAITRSVNPHHLRANLASLGFDLTPDDQESLRGLARGLRLQEPSYAPRWKPVPSFTSKRI